MIISCFTFPLPWKKRPKFSTEKVAFPCLFTRNLLYPLVNVTNFSFISLTQIFVLCLWITSARHSKFSISYLLNGWLISQPKINNNIRISYSLTYSHSKKEHILYEKINGSVGWNSTMSAMLCALYRGYFCKEKLLLSSKNSSIYTVVLHLLTFHVLEPHPSKDIALDLSHVISHQWRYYSTL